MSTQAPAFVKSARPSGYLPSSPGFCVDNSRILTIASKIANEGGLGDDIGGLPAVGIAPEWMSEKAIAIGLYFAASGVPIIFGASSPVNASKVMKDMMENKWWEMLNAGFYFEEDGRDPGTGAQAH